MPFDANKYHIEYVRETYKQFNLKVSRKSEQDLVEWLESQGNFQTYIKELVRKDMKRKLARTQAST